MNLVNYADGRLNSVESKDEHGTVVILEHLYKLCKKEIKVSKFSFVEI